MLQDSSLNKRGRLNAKDLITIGIFSAIYFVINFLFMLPSGIHPIIWMFLPGLVALFTGVPYMIMVSKVQKPLAVLIMGLICGLIYFATGMLTVVILITYACSSIIAESIRFVTGYKSFTGNMISFSFFSLGMIGSPLPIWLFRESFFAKISEMNISEEYINALVSLSTNTMLVIMIVAPLVLGIVGALIAKGLFRKHFRKAGIV